MMFPIHTLLDKIDASKRFTGMLFQTTMCVLYIDVSAFLDYYTEDCNLTGSLRVRTQLSVSIAHMVILPICLSRHVW